MQDFQKGKGNTVYRESVYILKDKAFVTKIQLNLGFLGVAGYPTDKFRPLVAGEGFTVKAQLFHEN